jgi:hypothetical protein
MANAVGTFLAHWTVGNVGAAGAPILKIEAMVSVAPTQRIVGTAQLTQAVNPPLDHQFEVVGTFHNAPIPGGERRFIHLHSVNTHRIGAPSIDILIELSEDWQKGTATYRYWIGSSFNEVRNVPVQATE